MSNQKIFVVKSRDTIKQLCLMDPHIIISIRCTGDTEAEIPTLNSTVDVLHLEFDDIDQRHYQYKDIREKYTFFSPQHAKKVLKFVERYINEVDYVICQCAAGISRSSGMAAALSLKYTGSDERFFRRPGPYVPNMLVYRILLKEMGLFNGDVMAIPPPPKIDPDERIIFI